MKPGFRSTGLRKMRTRCTGITAVGLALVGCTGSTNRGAEARFEVAEASIADIHTAIVSGRVNARQVVEAYLERIEAYDKQGPALNTIITINSGALDSADELDAAFAKGGLTGPLHGIPVIVKDNYDTHDLPTTAGSLSLEGSVPPDDAFQVRRIREAGAIVLAKSNMAEFAFSPYETVGSRLPGYTRNPYALNRVTAGSSGGTAASIAASFGTVGLGTDTGNSIRGPSSHQALVGIRSTMGLTSRDGIVPLNLGYDIGGPMARTVTDAVAVFEVIVGYDAADPVTAASEGKVAASYLGHLDKNGLQSARIGALREIIDDTADAEVVQRYNEALEDLRRLGAVIIDPVALPADSETRNREPCRRFAWDLNNYLTSLGPDAPVRSLADIIASGRHHPSIAMRLRRSPEVVAPEEQPGCARDMESEERFRHKVLSVFDRHDLDAMVFPTWDNPPRLIGDLNTPHGDNSQRMSPSTGFPAITVPMGYTRGTLPAGLQMLGKAFDEPRLIELAFAYEQGTRHRIAPASTPALKH